MGASVVPVRRVLEGTVSTTGGAVIRKVVRPITVKLTGTVLESDNSQAFLKLANGSMALRKIGDQVTNDPRDGKIIEITASEIVIQREDDEVRLKVGG